MLLAAVLVIAGMWLRVDWMNRSALWCDEAESSINALTILQTGVPGWKYLGLPVYENTLTRPWEGHPEYEFRDSSYSFKQGVVVYHGWLPIYSIAFSQWLLGMKPDRVVEPPRVLHGADQIFARTTIPRLPALVYSAGFLLLITRLGWLLGGPVCALAVLTLMALNASIVDFGFQARYYSMTLFMTAFAALALWMVVMLGRWRDFLLLGLVSGLLFHTHLFSVFVFSFVCLAATPFIIRNKGWLPKSLVGGGLAAALVLPWMILSGFLETADTVPKVIRLFESPWDILFYALSRPIPLLFLFSMGAILLGARYCPAWIDRNLGGVGHRVRDKIHLYELLFIWLITAYVAFHVIVPAASFFFERLTLVLWIPFALLLGLFFSDLLAGLRPRRALIIAVAFMVGLMALRGRLAFFEDTSLSQSRVGVAAIIDALSARKFEPGTRFYATPNDHLTWTYYTGLPVQSIAPIRRSFLESYPGEVVYLENQMDAFFPIKAAAKEALEAANLPVTDETIWNLRSAVWEVLSANDLRKRGILFDSQDGPWENPSLQQLKETTERAFEIHQRKYLADIQKLPIFRGVPFESIKETWLGFFVRFVNPEQRLGEDFNILPRLRSAEVQFVPGAVTVIYFSKAPSFVPKYGSNSD